MDLTKVLEFLPTLIKYGSIVKEVLDVARNDEDTIARLKQYAGPVFAFLQSYGAQLFPKAAAPIQAIGAAIATYDPSTTKWVQGAVNDIIKPVPPLVVDGIYGPLTRDGVIKLQEHLGLARVDGLAGRITQAAIDAFFAKQAMSAATTTPPTVAT